MMDSRDQGLNITRPNIKGGERASHVCLCLGIYNLKIISGDANCFPSFHDSTNLSLYLLINGSMVAFQVGQNLVKRLDSSATLGEHYMITSLATSWAQSVKIAEVLLGQLTRFNSL